MLVAARSSYGQVVTLKEQQRAASVSPAPRTASTATPRQHAAGVATAMGSAIANQTGAAIGALAFPALGPVGVVAVRQLIAALVLAPIARPPYRAMSLHQWRPVLGLAVTFSVMNLSLYTAVDRIGLGLAVTLEFLGPLTVAISTSRRTTDIAAAFAAVVGVVVLTHPNASSDLLGIGSALVAAVAWACYILLNRTLGRRMPGVQGTAAASTVSAVVWLPIAAILFVSNPPALTALLLSVGCALLSSVVPFTCDLLALRRVPANIFAILTSLNPVWAALVGWLVLAQPLAAAEWLGIGLIVVSNAVVTASGLLRRARSPSHMRPTIRHRPGPAVLPSDQATCRE
ncbi:DMT family transporter [Pseudonocardia lutea]|uniref:DMT family transporter n=1 Tax=Pseudonocardia lutea TaxID=2172015 RepID=A0ABW1IFQ4_9PSEU